MLFTFAINISKCPAIFLEKSKTFFECLSLCLSQINQFQTDKTEKMLSF